MPVAGGSRTRPAAEEGEHVLDGGGAVEQAEAEHAEGTEEGGERGLRRGHGIKGAPGQRLGEGVLVPCAHAGVANAQRAVVHVRRVEARAVDAARHDGPARQKLHIATGRSLRQGVAAGARKRRPRFRAAPTRTTRGRNASWPPTDTHSTGSAGLRGSRHANRSPTAARERQVTRPSPPSKLSCSGCSHAGTLRSSVSASRDAVDQLLSRTQTGGARNGGLAVTRFMSTTSIPFTTSALSPYDDTAVASRRRCALAARTNIPPL